MKKFNSFIYDIDSIIKRGDELDLKKSQLKSKDIPLKKDYGLDRTKFRDDDVVDLEKINNLKSSENYFALPTNLDFQISNNCKTISRISGDPSIRLGFPCLIKITYEDLIEFSFKIEKTEGLSIFLGFKEEGTNIEKGASNTSSSWMFYLLDGRFINGGEKKDSFYESAWSKPDKTELIVTLIIDTKTDEFSVKINGIESNKKFKMKINDIQKSKLVPVVDFRRIGDKISIF